MKNLTTVRRLFRQPDDYRDQTVTVAGWIRTLRDQKQFAFINLNDGTFFSNLQIVFNRETLANYDEIARLGNGSAIVATGRIVATPQARQPFELQADAIAVEGTCPPDYPLQPKRHTPEFLRSIAHLRPRTNLLSAVFRIRSVAAYAIHRFFNERDFVYVHTPIITGSDAEGAGQMFAVTTLDLQDAPRLPDGSIDYSRDFFGKRTNLTVSGQLNGEAFALAFRNIYTFGPTFRAEHSNTVKHASEFWMIEPEIAFADLEDDMQLAESMIKFIIEAVLRECPEEIDFCNQFVDKGLLERLQHVQNSRFGVMTYTEAIKELEKVKDRFSYPVFWGCDLQTEHERYLTEQLFQRPVFVIDYPRDIKAFYMKQNADGRTVAAMDCLVPAIGEIIGGSQREEDLDRLRVRMQEMGLHEEDYSWYLQLRQYGSVRHAGFGLGFERLIMYLTGVANIRDVIPFPRTTGSAEF
ncbi:MAG: asparagine--tRNA ligase [Ruminococcaceae bacterium]|nr:asparagine--tRNA ligase [Oscillospiraceae bacterium]